MGGRVYAEARLTWSPVRMYRAGETSKRADDERSQTVIHRPGKPVPEA